MIKEIFFTGKTIDEAWEKACQEMGYERDDKCYQIVDMGKKGFLGLGGTPAKIKIEVEVPDEVVKPKKEEKKPQPKKTQAKPQEPKKEEKKVRIDPKAKEKTKLAEDYIKVVLENMEIGEVVIETTVEDDGAVIKIDGEGIGCAIGRRGETLDALQYLASLVANRDDHNFYRISLDSGDYRAKRTETLKALAKRMANSAIKRGRNTTLEPMNPYERRIIHATVSAIEGVTSKSIGEEPNRRVVIVPANARRKNDKNQSRRRDNRERTQTPKVETASVSKSAPVIDEADRPLYSKIEL